MHWFPFPWPPHKKRHIHVVFTVGKVSVVLEPRETLQMATTDFVGQTLPLSIAFLDQNGNPMSATPDAPPVWSNNATIETVVPSADGLTALAIAIAVGTDTVAVSLSVGGKPFSANLVVTVTQQPQVLTSIAIVAGTPS